MGEVCKVKNAPTHGIFSFWQAVHEVQGVVSCMFGQQGFDEGLPCVVYMKSLVNEECYEMRLAKED